MGRCVGLEPICLTNDRVPGCGSGRPTEGRFVRTQHYPDVAVPQTSKDTAQLVNTHFSPTTGRMWAAGAFRGPPSMLVPRSVDGHGSS